MDDEKLKELFGKYGKVISFQGLNIYLIFYVSV